VVFFGRKNLFLLSCDFLLRLALCLQKQAKNAMLKTAIPLRALAILSALAIFSCQSPQAIDTTRKAVDPPLANTVPFRDFEVNADAGDTIELNEGTRIYIPGGIFQDENGKRVTGNVQLHYRAFYTPGQIAASGITMLYDTANATHDFTSAGMFEINGTQNGKKITIVPGEKIEMDFASSYNDIPFNFYALDTANAKWEFISSTKADTSKQLLALLRELAQPNPEPTEPRAYDPSQPVINLDLDSEDHPELAGYENVIWQYAGTGANPEKNKWIYDREWTSAKLLMKDTATCTYGLTLNSKDNTRSFTTDVFPSLRGENYKEALGDFRKNMLSFEATERVRQEKRKTAEETMTWGRRLSIFRFGTHNCDAFQRLGKVASRILEFHFDNPAFEKAREAVYVIVVAAGGRIISRYNGGADGVVNFVEGQNTRVVAVLSGTSQACVLSSSEFNEAVKNKRGILQMRSIDDKVSDDKELDAVISKL
jgi:hypothetical protein